MSGIGHPHYVLKVPPKVRLLYPSLSIRTRRARTEVNVQIARSESEDEFSQELPNLQERVEILASLDSGAENPSRGPVRKRQDPSTLVSGYG